MIDIFITGIGISVAVLCVTIVGCSLMLCDKISSLTHEIWELRMDLRRGENDEQKID